MISLSYKYILIYCGSFLLGLSGLYAQSKPGNTGLYDDSKRFSISVYGMYVSSAQLQDQLKSSDPVLRNSLVDLKGGYGYGAELDFKPSLYNLNLIFFISSEYLRIKESDLEFVFDNGTNTANAGMTEDFTMIPIEAGVKWPLPIGTDNFKIYIGGGGGAYFGKRNRTIANLQSSAVSTQPGFSLNVLAGTELYFAKNLSAELELKFRNGYFDAENSFPANSIILDGSVYQIENPFYSRLIADGVRISLGLNYHF